jgi:hypothetical protein
MPKRLKKLLWLPADALQWYLDILYEGHPLLRLAAGLSVSALGWMIFVLLHQIFR